MSSADRAGLVVGAAAAALAVGLAVTAPAAPASRGERARTREGALDDPGVARAAYAEIAAAEPELRATAAQDFPGDAWSQDDDFHGQELTRAQAIAGRHGARRGDVLRAIDDGMKQRWPTGGAPPPRATVPPCRPRLIY